MDDALAELQRQYHDVTGSELFDPRLDMFDLGTPSMAVLELIGRLRGLGYPVTVDDFVSATSMYEVTRAMAGARA